MTKLNQLRLWLTEIIGDKKNIENYVHFTGEDSQPGRHKISFNIYTDSYKYHITAIDKTENDGYLGCTTSCRKQRAGEDWTRGSDLPYGSFNRDTWERIKNGIIRNELVRLESKHVPIEPEVPVADEEKQ